MGEFRAPEDCVLGGSVHLLPDQRLPVDPFKLPCDLLPRRSHSAEQAALLGVSHPLQEGPDLRELQTLRGAHEPTSRRREGGFGRLSIQSAMLAGDFEGTP